MKLLVFIMSLLVLGLSSLPCADETAVEHKAAKHHEKTKHDDQCSPFCHCTCCAGFSINYFTASIPKYPQAENKCFTDYLPGNISEVSLPIWQPPQLLFNI